VGVEDHGEERNRLRPKGTKQGTRTVQQTQGKQPKITNTNKAKTIQLRLRLHQTSESSGASKVDFHRTEQYLLARSGNRWEDLDSVEEDHHNQKKTQDK
jgi:hypothetical protein